MEKLVLCTKFDKQVQGRYAKMKRVTSTPPKDFFGKRCVEEIKRIVEPSKELTFVFRWS